MLPVVLEAASVTVTVYASLVTPSTSAVTVTVPAVAPVSESALVTELPVALPVPSVIVQLYALDVETSGVAVSVIEEPIFTLVSPLIVTEETLVEEDEEPDVRFLEMLYKYAELVVHPM